MTGTVKKIRGFHHITAMAGDAAANVQFYTKVLGLRMVKVTVNYDDPGTYHLYYSDQLGTPGSVITFFPWGENAPAGVNDTGITAFTLRVPAGTLDAWATRLEEAGVSFERVNRAEGEVLQFNDESGHVLRIWAAGAPLTADKVVVGSVVPAAEQIAEVVGVEFTVARALGTRALLERMGLEPQGDGRYGFEGETLQYIDVRESANPAARMRFGAASVHHLAFAVADDAEEAYWQDYLMDSGQPVTEVKDRQYFRSVYMREPGGIILELATLEPGFAIDEPVESMGTRLVLPAHLESHRDMLLQHLAILDGVDMTGGK